MRRQQHLDSQSRHQKLLIALGFKSGVLTETYKKKLSYNKMWGKANRLLCRQYEAKYRARLHAVMGTVSNDSRYFWAAEKAIISSRLKKERANAAYKKMLQLLKMRPIVRNRRYHLNNLDSDSSGHVHPTKL